MEDEHGRWRIPGEMERLQIRENKKRKKDELRDREGMLTYPGAASGILHAPPPRLHTHHPGDDGGACRAAAQTSQ